MKNIDTAFRHIRSFSIVFIIACLILTCFYGYLCHSSVREAENRVLILLNGKVITAIASNRQDNILVEAKDHIKTFHELFFTLDPDDKVIKSNLTRALYLADNSAKQEYDNLQENGYYSGIIAGNISQTIQVDSVQVDIKSYPYQFSCHATEQITRTTSKVYRSLVTSGYLRNVSRSDNNPHGFLIEKWETLENKDLKTEGR